ncbi:cytochrome c [Rubritepida flocculans]|uniref:cytochrome c n=1 Tax=Rubritepida flocculans TaxID=182403 RepID=UPI0003FB7AA4|nr:cytochrome c [Rubritepida flocculans]
MKLLLAGLGLFAMIGAAAAQADLARIVTERREGLRAVGQHMEALQAIARSGGDPRPAVERIEAVQRFFVNFGQRFPAGTQQGAPGIETRALPAIWTDRAGFDRAEAALAPRLAALREAAAGGNAQAFGQALQAAGAACGDCHRPYRAR